MNSHQLNAEVVTEQTKFSFLDTTSDAEGCNSALAIARKKAIEKVCGVTVSGGSGRFRSEDVDELSLFMFEEVGGRIVSVSTTKKTVECLNSSTPEGESLKQCAIVAKIDVACDSGKRNPAFAPNFLEDVSLKETNLRDEEGMIVTVQARSNMYVSVFQFIPYDQSGKNVRKIFPNGMQTADFVKQNTTLSIPNSNNGKNYKLVVRLPKGKEHVVEELMIVATVDKIVFPEEMALETFQRVLSEIPLNMRREAMIPYRIAKKGTTK
jgi:hypothetical protein